MRIKTTFLIFLFCLLGTLSSSASNKLPISLITVINQSSQTDDRKIDNNNIREWFRSGNTSNRISFPTRTGFVLLRKEDIISISIDSKTGDLLLTFWKRTKVETARCQQNLNQVLGKLNEVPFVKISRSAIVNMDEVAAYEGTRRDASLVMSDGSKIKVSRNKSGILHDWISELSA